MPCLFLKTSSLSFISEFFWGAEVKAVVFPVIMYECESWTIKKAECRRMDTFELWCWRRLLRVPWTAKSSNQSILREISTEYSLERLMLKLKLQYFGHWMPPTHWKRPWCWQRLKARGEGDERGWDGWMASPTQWTWVWASFGSWRWTGKPSVLQSMRSQRVRHDWATELISSQSCQQKVLSYIFFIFCHHYSWERHVCGPFFMFFACPFPRFFNQKVKVLVTQSCLTLSNPMDCSPPG